MKPWQQYGMIALVSCAFVMVYAIYQPIIHLHDGHPWDADTYYHMAEQAAAGQPFSGEKPFIYRLGTPFLVGKLFAGNLKVGFYALNALFGIGSMLATFTLLNRAIASYRLVTLLLACLLLNPNNPVRLNSLFPIFTDASALFFITSIFALGKANKPSALIKLALLLLSAVGVLFREIVIIAPISLLIGQYYWPQRQAGANQTNQHLTLCAALLLGIIGIALTHRWAEGLGGYTFSSHVLYAVNIHLQHPNILLTAILLVYGPAFLLLMHYYRYSLSIISHHQDLLCYCLITVVLAVVAGKHTDRFIFWAFPAVLLVLGVIIENILCYQRISKKVILFWSILLITQLLAFRAFHQLPNADVDVLLAAEPTKYPDLVLFSAYGQDTNVAQLFAAYMGEDQRKIVLLQYLWLWLASKLTMPKLPSPHELKPKNSPHQA